MADSFVFAGVFTGRLQVRSTSEKTIPKKSEIPLKPEKKLPII